MLKKEPEKGLTLDEPRDSSKIHRLFLLVLCDAAHIANGEAIHRTASTDEIY